MDTQRHIEEPEHKSEILRDFVFIQLFGDHDKPVFYCYERDQLMSSDKPLEYEQAKKHLIPSTFENSPAHAKELQRFVDACGEYPSQERHIKTRREMIDLLNHEPLLGVICPIPAPDNPEFSLDKIESQRHMLYPESVMIELSLVLYKYLDARGIGYIKTRDPYEIFTTIVIGMEKKELIALSRFFYQEYSFFSKLDKEGVRLNEYLTPRRRSTSGNVTGRGWMEASFGPVVSLSSGGTFQFVFNLDF